MKNTQQSLTGQAKELLEARELMLRNKIESDLVKLLELAGTIIGSNDEREDDLSLAIENCLYALREDVTISLNFLQITSRQSDRQLSIYRI